MEQLIYNTFIFGRRCFIVDTILNKRLNEVHSFINYKEKYDFRYDIVKAYLIKLLPFRDTDNLYNEMLLFSQRYGKNITKYSDLIKYMCNEIAPHHNYNWIEPFLNNYGIDSYSFSENGSWLLGHNVQFYESKVQFYENYLKRQFQTSLSDNIKVLGYYAEYLTYKYLLSNPNKYSNVDWVSQTIGDGLGYDFIAYNKNTSKWNYIEVKSKVSTFDTTLSENESKKLFDINTNNLDEDYLLFLLPIQLIDDHFDYDILECYIDDNNDKNSRFESLITSDSYIIFNSLDAQKEELKRKAGIAYKKKISFLKGRS